LIHTLVSQIQHALVEESATLDRMFFDFDKDQSGTFTQSQLA